MVTVFVALVLPPLLPPLPPPLPALQAAASRPTATRAPIALRRLMTEAFRFVDGNAGLPGRRRWRQLPGRCAPGRYLRVGRCLRCGLCRGRWLREVRGHRG